MCLPAAAPQRLAGKNRLLGLAKSVVAHVTNHERDNDEHNVQKHLPGEWKTGNDVEDRRDQYDPGDNARSDHDLLAQIRHPKFSNRLTHRGPLKPAPVTTAAHRIKYRRSNHANSTRKPTFQPIPAFLRVLSIIGGRTVESPTFHFESRQRTNLNESEVTLKAQTVLQALPDLLFEFV